MNTLFLIGSGALQHPWTPVINALRETEFPYVRAGDAASFAMSRLVYNLRMLWHLESDEASNKDLLNKYNRVRQKIAAKLRARLPGVRRKRDGRADLALTVSPRESNRPPPVPPLHAARLNEIKTRPAGHTWCSPNLG